jgi:hypothetical protein
VWEKIVRQLIVDFGILITRVSLNHVSQQVEELMLLSLDLHDPTIGPCSLRVDLWVRFVWIMLWNGKLLSTEDEFVITHSHSYNNYLRFKI